MINQRQIKMYVIDMFSIDKIKILNLLFKINFYLKDSNININEGIELEVFEI